MVALHPDTRFLFPGKAASKQVSSDTRPLNGRRGTSLPAGKVAFQPARHVPRRLEVFQAQTRKSCALSNAVQRCAAAKLLQNAEKPRFFIEALILSVFFLFIYMNNDYLFY
jgi:hypothetical protein